MAVTDSSIVAKSNDVKDAALNLKAKSYELRRTLAAVWDLDPTKAEPPAPESTFSLDLKNPGGESVVNKRDGRTKVDPTHFAPGGKYRCMYIVISQSNPLISLTAIVKLFAHYEFQEPGGWAMGTGWLIAPDVFVTAGHCSYDWAYSMGRATEVKAYIGYSGRKSEKNPDVQFRHVKRIVTSKGWVETKGQKPFDVSFMQVDKPFDGVTPIKYEQTPAKGNLTLGVVGYPGDKFVDSENGAEMYEMFLPTTYDLATQADIMLDYRIDTFGGRLTMPLSTYASRY